MFVRNNKIGTLSGYLLGELNVLYDAREARSVHDILFMQLAGLSRAEVTIRAREGVGESLLLAFHKALNRLKTGEPVQYVTGVCWFDGMALQVGPGVLIPRPETEELVHALIGRVFGDERTALDIGTGSGCIALAMKKQRPGWQVHAADISGQALSWAMANAQQQQLEVIFHRLDILKEVPQGKFDVVVSNPPYIPASERGAIHDSVKEFEPGIALFVDDSDPLLFYRRLAQLAPLLLHPGAHILVEIHENFGSGVAKLFAASGFSGVEVYTDLQGKQRGVFARFN